MSDGEPDFYSTDYGRQHAPPDWSTVPEPEPAPAAPRARHSSEADYPYDPALRIEMQVGLDKLRCIADRGWARQLYQLHVALEPRWKDGRAKQWREEDDKDREAAEHQRLSTMSERAFKGELGEAAKQLAAHILFTQGYKTQRRTDLPALREFAAELRKLRNGR